VISPVLLLVDGSFSNTMIVAGIVQYIDHSGRNMAGTILKITYVHFPLVLNTTSYVSLKS
jgi:hypothetical protein